MESAFAQPVTNDGHLFHKHLGQYYTLHDILHNVVFKQIIN